jgi:hypothetical protein
MSDYNRSSDNFDKYGNPIPGAVPGTVYEPAAESRAPYVLLGLLVLVGIVGGALYFNGTPAASRRGADVATAPPAVTDTVRTPAAPTLPTTRPMDATPAPSTMPAPGATPKP